MELWKGGGELETLPLLLGVSFWGNILKGFGNLMVTNSKNTRRKWSLGSSIEENLKDWEMENV